MPLEPLIPESFLRQTHAHGLVLFVGSGVNGEAALRWNSLLKRLVDTALKSADLHEPVIGRLREQLTSWCMQHYDSYGKASLAKLLLGKRYLLEMRKALYERDRRKGADDPKFVTLDAVALLASTRQVRAIVTFNYDDFLARAVELLGKRNPVIVNRDNQNVWERSVPGGDLPIYHVHGFLPPADWMRRLRSEGVVFSFDEYFHATTDALSWETATPLHLLRNHCTLWIGSSLTDWNMLRLLEVAFRGAKQPLSYCLVCQDDFSRTDLEEKLEVKEGDRSDFRRVAMRLHATLLRSVGVQQIGAGESHEDVREVICEIAKQLEPEEGADDNR